MDVLTFIMKIEIQYNIDGLFTADDSNSFFECLRNSSYISRKQLFWIIFLFHHKIVCCVYSLELSHHRGNSNECIQHTIIVKKI